MAHPGAPGWPLSPYCREESQQMGGDGLVGFTQESLVQMEKNSPRKGEK